MLNTPIIVFAVFEIGISSWSDIEHMDQLKLSICNMILQDNAGNLCGSLDFIAYSIFQRHCKLLM